MKYDAVIKNYVRKGDVIWGYIYDDSKGRFADGTFIHTSKIVSIDGDILKTRNSVYILEKSFKVNLTGPH